MVLFISILVVGCVIGDTHGPIFRWHRKLLLLSKNSAKGIDATLKSYLGICVHSKDQCIWSTFVGIINLANLDWALNGNKTSVKTTNKKNQRV